MVRENPCPGLLSHLAQIESQGQRLSADELTSLVFVLLVAGHETTVHLINSAMRLLLQNKDQRARLLGDWNLLDSAIDEVLRFDSPVYLSKPRFVTCEYDFHGATLKKGEAVMAMLGAANADPQRFDNPELFDIGRSKNYHMTFGSGPHVCLGMKLAKSECAVAIRHLFEAFPDIGLHDYRWQRRLGMMGMKQLHLNCLNYDMPLGSANMSR